MDLEEAPRRRRGQELEDAILDAAWAQLAEAGYPGFSIDAVAKRAETSRPVIYRRWDDRTSLAEAAIVHKMRGERNWDVPDTGSLRGDMLSMLRAANSRSRDTVAMLAVLVGANHIETGHTFAELRERALGVRARTMMDVALDRAVERGEADPARLTPRVRTVAFDLFRHDQMMTFRPLPDDDLVAIVDEVFLPLVLKG